jgi:hypothetical protein
VSREDVAVVAFFVTLLVAVLWRKDVKAAASFLGLMSFTLEAKDVKQPASARTRRPHAPEPRLEVERRSGSCRIDGERVEGHMRSRQSGSR